MISIKIQADTRPDLKALYTHADVRVMGVPLFICVAPVYWELDKLLPGISVIGYLDSEWKWHLGAKGLDVYRSLGPGKQERLSIEAWAERQLEQAPSALFGWEAPPAPVGVSRG